MIASGRFLASSMNSFRRLVGLLVVDQEQDRIGDQSRQRNEIGAGGLRLPAEQLVDLFVAGNSVIVRKQRIAVRLGIGADLRPDLSAGTGFGFDHHRLFDDRLQRGCERPRHEIVDATWRKRVDDGDGVRGKGVLREGRPHRDCACRSGRADDETAPIHVVLPDYDRRHCRCRHFLKSKAARTVMVTRAAFPKCGAWAPLSLHAADVSDRLFDAGGVGVPEFGEFRRVEVFDLLAEIGH